MEFKRITNHDIRITHSENGGCIVKVGCGTFAFSTPDEMLEALKQFYSDPQKMEKEYNRIVGGPVAETVEPDCAQEAPYEENQNEFRGHHIDDLGH